MPARPLWAAGLGPDPGHDDLRRQRRVRQDRQHRCGGRRSVGRRALEAGINLFDTANIYSWGLSEEILGQVLRGRRERVLITTKARMKMGDGPNDAGLSRHHLIAACEASLKRLGTDWIDLYQLHEWDGQTPLEETLEALDTLVRSGKVRYVGASNYSGWHLMKALAIADARGWQRFVSQQIHYTLEAARPSTSWCRWPSTRVSASWSGGRWPAACCPAIHRGQPHPPGSRHLAEWGEPPIRDEARLYDIIEVLVAIAAERGVSAAQVALAWLLGRPGICTLVIGARTEEQLLGNLGAAATLTADERTRLDQVSAPPLLYPYWHQARTSADRLGPADLALLGP